MDCVWKIIEPLVNKLKEATIDEIKFQWGFNDEIKKLTNKLGEMKKLTFNPRPNTTLAKVEEARHAAFDIEDVLEEFELLESNKPSNFCEVNNIGAFMHYFIKTAKLRFQFHQKVKSIEQEQELVLQGEGQTAAEEEEDSSPPVGHYQRGENVHIVGMDTEFVELLDLVERPRNYMRVITVWGPGGSGKTTLVNKVFERVKMNSEIKCCAWVSVNQSSPIEVLRSMVKEISRAIGKPVPKVEELLGLSENELRQRIGDDLKKKRYVLILDDVWKPETTEYIAPLPANNMSSVIVTSRQGDIAVKFIIQLGYGVGSPDVKLNPLNPELSWDLFCKAAFLNNTPPGSCPNNSIERIGRELVARCNGLPLAILTIGKLMSTKGDDSRKWDKSVRISIHKLIRLWIAEGFVKNDDRQTPEAIARGYFDELINRSMLQFRYESKSFQMHDLLREVSVHMMAKENFGKSLHQNTLVEDERRLAIHVKAPNVQLDTDKLKLRSLVAGSGVMFYSSLSQMLQNIKLIRTLDLEGACVIYVPDEVGDLIHLRYLSLRWSKLIEDLPDSIKKLRHLQTLDILRYSKGCCSWDSRAEAIETSSHWRV
ncbi:uncharacterized protein LOC128071264 [Budorcas taxicolor]|uniref:uncharacterized protein LOC128071264 n=1 Tax=Budorcas taxicolor TaxID=37181 RepID=UPI002284D47A|nr:uncharacterized protein LOC128071264 [Budorcas taxicolor]